MDAVPRLKAVASFKLPAIGYMFKAAGTDTSETRCRCLCASASVLFRVFVAVKQSDLPFFAHPSNEFEQIHLVRMGGVTAHGVDASADVDALTIDVDIASSGAVRLDAAAGSAGGPVAGEEQVVGRAAQQGFDVVDDVAGGELAVGFLVPAFSQLRVACGAIRCQRRVEDDVEVVPGDAGSGRALAVKADICSGSLTGSCVQPFLKTGMSSVPLLPTTCSQAAFRR